MRNRLSQVAAWVTAVGTGLSGLAAAMDGGQRPVIHMSCRVAGQTPGAAPDFERQFCATLLEGLPRELEARFQPVAGGEWTGNGRGLRVEVRLISPHAATVTLTVGQIRASAFTPESSASTHLASYDRDLTPGAATSLVRSIGLALGLIP
jgi:hypothetical protein